MKGSSFGVVGGSVGGNVIRATTTTSVTHPSTNMNGTTKKTSSSSSSHNHHYHNDHGIISILLVLKWSLLELPLLISLTMFLLSYGLYEIYTGPMYQLIESYKLPTQEVDHVGFYVGRDNDITYYNRHCSQEDITTHDANDLYIRPTYTTKQRRDVMMTHGAVVMPNILSNTTAIALRNYLEGRHDVFHNGTLPWHEKFWDGENGNRLALGLGPYDDPSIARAMAEVGTNKQVQKTIESILGPNPALVELSTLSTMTGASAQAIHSDSDYFGSSLLYSRTFLHSYTLFIALQDTSAKLGATTVCPGTHMCADVDLSHLCMFQHEDVDTSSTGTGGGRLNHLEASSNGLTGKDVGMLYRGDGMMFNQNVWHRGPRNHDPQFLGMNRVMFILTFVSRREYDKGDSRQQGWGTYYYMRHNMWGQTYQDLKLAVLPTLMNGISLPWRLWRAYGEGNSNFQGTGAVTWLEHWARQTANSMDFYSWYELRDFKYLIEHSSPIPRIFWGDTNSPTWYGYILDMFTKLKNVSMMVYGGILVLYLTVYLIYGVGTILWSSSTTTTATSTANSSSSSTSRIRPIVRFMYLLMIKHLLVGGVAGIGWYMVHHRTPLFRRIHSGRIFFKPFPTTSSPPSVVSSSSSSDMSATTASDSIDGGGPSSLSSIAHLTGRITTFPERMDVLIGTRFDATWLGLYNDMLEYHPGNKEWNRLIDQVAGKQTQQRGGGVGTTTTTTSIPFPLTDVASRAVMEQTQKPLQGVPRRFLLQDYLWGYWTVMTPSEVLEENRRAIMMAQYPVLQDQAKYWKEVLSESRFGLLRTSSYARKLVPLIVNHWLVDVVFASRNSTSSSNSFGTKKKKVATVSLTRPSAGKHRKRTSLSSPSSSVVTRTIRSVRPNMKKSVRPSTLRGWLQLAVSNVAATDDDDDIDEDTIIILNEGDYVLMRTDGQGYPRRGKIVQILSPTRCRVKSLEKGRITTVSIDEIEPLRPVTEGDHVEIFDEDDEPASYKVGPVHPLGTCIGISSDGSEESLDLYGVQTDEEYLLSYRLAQPSNNNKMKNNESATAASGVPLNVGQLVMANYEGQGHYFPGEIVKITSLPESGGYVYDIEYEDGDVEEGVVIGNIVDVP